MQSALHITTKVLPGNRLEVQLPPGSEGREVSIFVVLAEPILDAATQFDDLAEMAADPDIQRELAVINADFSAAEMDGLDSQSSVTQ